jgi:membrane associated rhomboid family serine protease
MDPFGEIEPILLNARRETATSIARRACCPNCSRWPALHSGATARLVFCGAMQIHIPDPAYTGSERARANFRLAAKLAFGFVALIWLIQLLNWAVDLGPEDFGVRPRQWAGLVGILFAPLVHGGFVHLIGNSVPLLILGTTMLYLYPNSAIVVLPAVYLGPGVAVWLFARGSSHVGASGLIYGLVSYIFIAGVIRRDRRAIAASLLVCFLYGALVWGVLPVENGVSWETHLAAAVIGAVLAVVLRHRDIPPRVSYSWENAPDEPVEVNEGYEGSEGGEGSEGSDGR